MDKDQIIKDIAIVCKCKTIKHRTIREAIQEKGAKTIADIQRLTMANTGCGKVCLEKITEMLEEYKTKG